MRDIEDDLYRNDRRTGGAGARRHPLSDEDYLREMDKLGRAAGATDRRRADEEAIHALRPGMGAEGGGVRGFIGEMYPDRGRVYIESYERGTEVPAHQVRPTDPEERERFERATGIARRREDLEELWERYGDGDE